MIKSYFEFKVVASRLINYNPAELEALYSSIPGNAENELTLALEVSALTTVIIKHAENPGVSLHEIMAVAYAEYRRKVEELTEIIMPVEELIDLDSDQIIVHSWQIIVMKGVQPKQGFTYHGQYRV